MIVPDKVLVTGAGGFIGRALVDRLSHDGCEVRGCVRRAAASWPTDVECVVFPDAGPDTDWTEALVGVDAIVHCAARVHILKDIASDPLGEFRRVNVGGTLNLARQGARAGVRRFIFVSSIGVNGAETFDAPFRADDEPKPDSPYAVSKYEAEAGLRRLSQETGVELVIIRPPLVVGPNAPGNLQRLLQVLHRGIPLPSGRIRNLRSLVAVSNLADLIAICIRHPSAADQMFLVSDGEDLSTTDLLNRPIAGMNSGTRLIPVPTSALRMIARLLGRPEAAQRLCGSLQVDIAKTRQLLGWTPRVSVDESLNETVRAYLAQEYVADRQRTRDAKTTK